VTTVSPATKASRGQRHPVRAVLSLVRPLAGVVASRNWLRWLLALLGASELLMAAGAPAALLVVGAVGGLCLVAAAWLTPPPRTFLLLVIIGTVPFAVLAWTAIAPVLLTLAAAAVSVPLVRFSRHGRRAPAATPTGRP
jgi:hypothetical protein